MTLRRLVPYVVIFLVLAGVYGGLRWRQEKQAAQEEQAKEVFHLKESDISDLRLIRGTTEMRLTKKDKEWRLTHPLESKADQTTVDLMLTTLARLRKDRDLGTEKDLKPFGLDKPQLVVKFTAQGQERQLMVGAKVPGDLRSYYVLRDQDPNLFTISRGSKDTLDRDLLTLRDKTLLSFIVAEATGLKIKSGRISLDLERTGPEKWRRSDRPDLRVRGDRVEKLLRELHIARIKSFLEPPPKNLRVFGLAPRPRMAISVVTPTGSQTLSLGAPRDGVVYARRGEAGPVVLVDAALHDAITKTLTTLEDRRLWTGAISEIAKVVWGPPPRTWIAVKDQAGWKITGPDQAAAQQPAARLEMALWNFQKLEAAKLLPKSGAPPAAPAFVLELFGQDGKPLLHLVEVRAGGKGHLKVYTQAGEKSSMALVPREPFRKWQEEMQRLTASASKPQPTPAKTPGDQ